MRMVMLVVMLPCLQFLLCVLHRHELVDVQELVSQPTVGWRDSLVVHGLFVRV